MHPQDNFPFRVIADWQNGHISIQQGEEGHIFAHSPDGKQLRVSIPRYNHPIIIPADVVQVGTRPIRDTSRSSSDASEGRNFDTLLGRAGERDAVYYKTTIPGVMEQYRRGPFKCWNSDDGRTCLGSFNRDAHRFYLEQSLADKGPQAGDNVYFVYEIWNMDQDVPEASWARLPVDGIYDDHELARRLRISVEWRDEQTSRRKKMYLLSPCHDQLQEGKPPQSYIDAITIVRGLRQETVKNPPSWMPESQIPVVMEVSWDHLQQEHTLGSTTSRRINPPQKIPRRDREEKLVELGAKNFGGKYGEVPPGKGEETGTPRRACDRCYVGNKANLGKKADDVVPACDVDCKCVAINEEDPNSPCTRCENIHGIRCSWTADDEITDKYIDAVLHDKESPYSMAVDDMD